MPEFQCEECGELASNIDDAGCGICVDCALETYSDLEALLDIAMRDATERK